MGKLQKKGQKGAAANYITRQQALKKLQLSLADFRRLCILKGIYPREPKNKKKANKGSSAPATFYYVKDIQFLLHEPLLQKFREYKIFAKKLNKVLHKGEYSTAKSIEENCKPVYTLDHIVKERYPTFIDALRDLDDALSMLFLFSNMPTNDKIKAAVVKDCQKLIAEFQAYVMQSRSLRKVFFSIKGIYYQADIKGQTVTWIVPYQFAQHVPDEVDFRVMLTFLEFYQTLMGFVNFRLYNEINLSYPPKIESLDGSISFDKVAAKFGDADSAAVDADEADAALDEFKSAAKEGGENGEGDADDDLRKIQQVSNEASTLRNLFSKCVFFISRETPRYALEFMIRSCGGQVSWDESVAPNPPFPETDERITHQISDRPKINNRILSRTYIQPQWIADCINARKLLRTSLYEPGVQLPPHLSPFVEAKEGDYVPEGIPSEDEDENEVQNQAKAAVPEDEEEVYERELKAEASGVSFNEYQEKKASEEAEEEETEEKPKKASKPKKRTAEEIEAEEEEQQKEMAAQMLSNKQRKLYKSIKMSRERKSEETAKLERKKRQIEEKKKNMQQQN